MSVAGTLGKKGFSRICNQVVQKEHDQESPSHCVIVSINSEQKEYITVLGHWWQDHTLVVETIHFSSESSLIRALQEVKDDGSPSCILIEPSNVKLSSCTIIMLHGCIKSFFLSLVHCHMLLEDALCCGYRKVKIFL